MAAAAQTVQSQARLSRQPPSSITEQFPERSEALGDVLCSLLSKHCLVTLSVRRFPVYFFSLGGVTVSISASLMAPGALMIDMKLLLPIMLRSGKLTAMRNFA